MTVFGRYFFMNREYINREIWKYYKVEDNSKLAKRLGLTVTNLRKKASRMNIKKGTKSNKIVGECKLCSRCKKILPIENFRKDKYQPEGLDYNCKLCRNKNNKIIKESNSKKNHTNKSMAFGKKKTRNPVLLVEGEKCLRCKSCEKILPIENFHRDKNNHHGHKNFCKSCISEKKQKT